MKGWLRVHPALNNRLLRSYAKIQRPEPTADFLMIIEYQKAVLESNAVGRQIDHDFFTGICTKKDSVVVLVMRQLHEGAVKTVYLDNLHIDRGGGLINRAFGQAVEICDNYSPHRMAYSPCAIQRIPDNLSHEAIDALIDNVPGNRVDEIISNYVFRGRPPGDWA